MHLSLNTRGTLVLAVVLFIAIAALVALMAFDHQAMVQFIGSLNHVGGSGPAAIGGPHGPYGCGGASGPC
jgi:hypothetical protein